MKWVAVLSLLVALSWGALNIHVVPHTHDDVGWLKTPDEYYYGANSSIQSAGVQYIIDTVVYALQQNPDRKFIYVEMAFFWRWWREQSPDMQAVVKQLVANGQLEFINGGWTMHDEAAVHFEDMVDQMTLGHRFLAENFQIVPKIGWQLDPFGHSKTSAVLDSLAGFEGLFFARMDYQDELFRVQNRGMEMWWTPSESNPNIKLLTGMMLGGYCSPSGFMFEYGDDPIQDDPLLEDYDVDAKARELLNVAQQMAGVVRHNDIMFAWGCDFMYQNAHMMYKNMEKLINYINNNAAYNSSVKMFYSTPSKYAEAILANTSISLPLKTDDFMPYADSAHAYWTGYFVSRSTLKGYVRYSSHILHAVSSFFAGSQVSNAAYQAALFAVQEPNGVTTHHDAVSGTEQQHVADDYALRLTVGNNAAFTLFSDIIGDIITTAGNAPVFTFCPLLNESICAASSAPTTGVLPVVIYNPLGWTNFDYVKFPVSSPSVSVSDAAGTAIPSQIIPSWDNTTYSLVFPVTIGPLGFNTYFVTYGASQESTGAAYVSEVEVSAGPYTLANEFLSLLLDAQGNFVSVTDLTTQNVLNIAQQYLYYVSNPGDSVSGQASGAYIFRPATQTAVNYTTAAPTVQYFKGPLFTEVRRYWQPDCSQVIRVFAGQNWIEVEDIIGPIDISDGNGKEVITKYTTNLASQGTWHSDSNGIELVERKLNYRPSWNYTITEPVSGNYVPLNAITTIQDYTTNLQLSVVVDRSRSVASLADGELETMIHRRCLHDDGRGVGEPLNESTIMAAKQWLVFSPAANSSSNYRPLAKRQYHPFVLAFPPAVASVQAWTGSFIPTFAPLGITIPPNVQLLDFVPIDSGNTNGFILRFHHIYQVGEDAVLSQPVTFDISGILLNNAISYIVETQLTSVAQLPGGLHMEKVPVGDPINITLDPASIHTYVVQFQATSTKVPQVPEIPAKHPSPKLSSPIHIN